MISEKVQLDKNLHEKKFIKIFPKPRIFSEEKRNNLIDILKLEGKTNDNFRESDSSFFIIHIKILKVYIKKIFFFSFLLTSLILFYNKLRDNEIKTIETYIKQNMEGFLSYSKSAFKKVKIPKITIVISVFNGEGFLKPVLRSIQNQNFLDIEIIIVDDASLDNSIKIIKELMEEDPRIILLLNDVNRGTLYTKSRGVLNAKGKYVMTLDHDDFYATKEVFYKLYQEAERNQLELLGFASIYTTINIIDLKEDNYRNYINTPIIKKPFIKDRFLSIKIREKPSCTLLCLYFIKTDLYLNILTKLGDNFIHRNIDDSDDTIVVFLLSRYAQNLKHLKKIFHVILVWPNQNSPNLTIHNTVKYEEREKKNCFSYITYTEALLLFSENNYDDKKFAEISFLDRFLRNEKCNKKISIKSDIIRVCNLYLNNEYISSDTKKEILFYLNRTFQNNSFS